MSADAPTTPVPTTASATHADAPHDEHHVHVYESGISEGNARVPWWLTAVILSLLAFYVYYLVAFRDAQPSTAHVKPDAPASPATPASPAPPAAMEGS
jgi:hypothetical protein